MNDEMVTVTLTRDELTDVQIGLGFLATFCHESQIKDWKIVPTDGPRGKHFVAWKKNWQRVIAHHEGEIDRLSALAGRLGGRDWRAAERAPTPSAVENASPGGGPTERPEP